MHRHRLQRALGVGLLLCLLTAADAASARIACMNRGGDALPADAFPVPVSRAAEMQQLLAVHGRIRLDPGGDYGRATRITIRSGQAIFGAAGTRIGRLIVAPGTSGAIVSGVVPDALEFPPSTLITHDNCFERFAARSTAQAPLTLVNTFIRDNLFLDVGKVVIDTSTGGSVLNNRFIRTMTHSDGPTIRLTGAKGAGRDRNVFVWTNVLAPPGDGIIATDQAQMNMVGLDAESWNQRGLAGRDAMMTVARVATLRAFMFQGGDYGQSPGRLLDIDAQGLDLLGLRVFRSAQPAVHLGKSTERAISVGVSGAAMRDENPAAARLEAFESGHGRMRASDVFAGGWSRRPRAAAATPWEPPQWGPVPAPIDGHWRAVRQSAPDSTARLQAMLDGQRVVNLPAGAFYISSSLRMKDGQVIVGAGAGRTAIIARSGDVDIIRGADAYADKRATTFGLVDITLQGGRAGIRHDAAGAGRGAQFHQIYLSHVLIRDMSQAGVVIDGIYGWDNNLIDNLTVVDVPAGILQIPNPAYSGPVIDGDIAGMNYMDKNVCYRCRFVDVDVGLDLAAKRANNLNACINCLFARNRRGAARLANNTSTVFANCDFEDNAGQAVLSGDELVGITSSRFTSSRGNPVYLSADAICESCEFHAATPGTATVADPAVRVTLANSRLVNVGLGNPRAALLLETDTGAGSARLGGHVVSLMSGKATVIVPGQAQPDPGLLVDWTP